MGGATFNPTAAAAVYVVGVPEVSFFPADFRFPAQAAEAAGRALNLKRKPNSDELVILLEPSHRWLSLAINIKSDMVMAAEAILKAIIW